METQTRNNGRINHRPNKKFNEEKSDSLWSLFDVRLPALCHKLLMDNQTKDPNVIGQGRSKQNDLDSRSEKPRLIKVKSAKCQVDPREVDTALAKMSRPKRQRKRKQMENLASEHNVCSDQKTSDRHLPGLDLNEKGAGIKPLDIIKCGTGNGLKDDGSQGNAGFTKLETKKIMTGNQDRVEREVCDVDKAGANNSTGAQFRGHVARERTKDTRDSATETTSLKKQRKAEFPQKQNRTVDTNQIREIENHKDQVNDGTVHMNHISETECLKEQPLSTTDMIQITVSEPELSNEENTVEINKIHETQKLDYIPNNKPPKCTAERRLAEIQDNHLTNNIHEPMKPKKASIKFENRDKLSEPKRHNKSETVIMSTGEMDTSIDYINVTTETGRNDARQIECRDAQDTTIDDNSVSETDTNSLSETVCKEELDNAANEKISKAGCKEEQDNIANDEKNTSETMVTEQHNNIVPNKDNVKGETHEKNTNETLRNKVTKRNNTSETELSEKLDNTSRNCKITLGCSGETACLAERDMNNLSVTLGLDVTKETTETLKQTQNVKIKEECSAIEEMTSQMSNLDDLSNRNFSKQKEITGSDIHKIVENEDPMITCNATRQHREHNTDKNQQKECSTAPKNDKLETESRLQKEQETSESECKLQHEPSQQEYTKVPELHTGQTDCRKELTGSQPDYRNEKHNKSQQEYTKVPQLKTEQIEYKKEHDKTQPECRKEKHDSTQREGRKEQELDSQQIKSGSVHYVSQPEYKNEHKTSQSECRTEVENDEDTDNDLKLVVKDNLETDKRQNNTSTPRNHHEQNATAETTDFQANPGEWGSKRAASEAIHDQENIRKTSECGKCEGATNKANIETKTDILKSDEVSAYLESNQQTIVLPKPELNDDRPDLVEVCDNHRTQKPELSNLDGQDVSIKLPTRNNNVIHQTADNSNLGTHFLAFEVETQAITVEKPSPLCSLSAKTAAVSDSIRKGNQISTPNSTKNNLKSCAKNDVLLLLPQVCNNATKKPTKGISGMHSDSTCVITIPSNSTPPKESGAFIQMISRRVSAYVLDRKTNTARIVPLDSSIDYTLEQGDNESAVFSEDIHFQNCRLWCQNSEDRQRRVSSVDPRYFQSNQIEELLRSGSTRRSRSESLTRRCALNKEWEILTKTTREELTIFSPTKQSSKKIKETVSSKECSPKCSVNINSIKLQKCEVTPEQQVLHESIHLQPLCSSISVDNKSNRNSNHTILEFSASPVCQELSVANLTAMEKPVCCSRATKTGNDVPGNRDVQKSTTELFAVAMEEHTKPLAESSKLDNFETSVSLGRHNCSSVDTNTCNKLTTNICQQCGDTSTISWCNTNKNPRHSEVLPDICMKTNHEVPSFGQMEQDSFKADGPMLDLNCCDTEMLADLNSKESGSSRTETGYDSTEKELSIINDGSSRTAIKTKYQNRDISFGDRMESFSHEKAQVSGDSFVEVIDPTNFTARDVEIQCKPYESREVFTQTEANNFVEQSQPVVIQHSAHGTSDVRTTNSKERNLTSADNIRFQQSAYPKAHPVKYIPTEEIRNEIEKLDFIQNYTTKNSTSTGSTDTVQTEIRVGGLVAKELAGYIFYKDKIRKSRMPYRTNVKSEIKRSSSLSDVQTDLQNTLLISEKLGTLLETGQTVLVLKLPPSDCCLMLP